MLSLRCNLGQILDLSATGLRVRRRWRMRPGSAWTIGLKGHAIGGPLIGRVAWCRRIGFFQYEVGVEFLDPDPAIVYRLATLAGCAGRPLLAQSFGRAA